MRDTGRIIRDAVLDVVIFAIIVMAYSNRIDVYV